MEDTRALDTATPGGDRLSFEDGPLESLFLTMLPVELRLKIYEEVFKGSRADAVSFPWYTVPNIYDFSIPLIKHMLRPSHHHQLLLTCHGVYKEALSVYWSLTVIGMGGSDPCLGSGGMIAVIPGHARQLTQHITNVAYPHGGDTWGYEGWTFAKTLSHLPRLKTCRLADSNPVDSEDIHGYYLGDFIEPEDSTPEFKDRRIMLQGLSDAGCRRASILCEDPFYTAIVIQKFRAEYRHPVYEKEVLRECFINHTAEYIYHRIVESRLLDSNDDLSDDYGFQRAICDAPPAPLRPRLPHNENEFTLEYLYNKLGRI